MFLFSALQGFPGLLRLTARYGDCDPYLVSHRASAYDDRVSTGKDRHVTFSSYFSADEIIWCLRCAAQTDGGLREPLGILNTLMTGNRQNTMAKPFEDGVQASTGGKLRRLESPKMI